LKLRRRRLFTTFALLAALLFVVAGAVFSQIRYYNTYLKAISSELRKKTPAFKQLQDMRSKTSVIRGVLNSRNRSLDVLYEIHSIIPDDIFLRSFSLDEKGEVILQGNASNMSGVFAFVADLEKSALLKNVKVRYASKRKRLSKESADFQIVCQVEAQN